MKNYRIDITVEVRIPDHLGPDEAWAMVNSRARYIDSYSRLDGGTIQVLSVSEPDEEEES